MTTTSTADSATKALVESKRNSFLESADTFFVISWRIVVAGLLVLILSQVTLSNIHHGCSADPGKLAYWEEGPKGQVSCVVRDWPQRPAKRA